MIYLILYLNSARPCVRVGNKLLACAGLKVLQKSVRRKTRVPHVVLFGCPIIKIKVLRLRYEEDPHLTNATYFYVLNVCARTTHNSYQKDNYLTCNVK